LGELVHPDFGVERVKLAGEPSFTVGRLTAHPSTRQIIFGKQQLTLEPRVMQVLVALARAGGEVVSKDELIDRCWYGRVVGEDAVNRVVSRLRHVASTIGDQTFRIDTIRGVGYRLINSQPAGDTTLIGQQRLVGAQRRLSRRMAMTGLTAAGAAAIVGTLLLRKPRHEPLPLAFQYYQRGLETRGQNSLALTEQGAALFREATRIDPLFADAWGALAWSYRALMQYGPRPDLLRLQALCRSAAARALELDPDNAEAQAALLLLKPFYRNWAEIEDGCRRLLQRHPHNSILEFNLGATLAEVGRWRASIQYFRAVADREPFWPLAHINLVEALYCGGKTEEAEDILDDGMKRFPRRVDLWLTKVRYLAISGRLPEALSFASDESSRPASYGVEPETHPEVALEIAMLQAAVDGSAAARDAVLQKVMDAARQAPSLLGAVVRIALLGDVDTSISVLEGFYLGQGPWAYVHYGRPPTGFLFRGDTFPVRRHARFPSLLRRIGLEAYWRSTGTLPDYRRFPEAEYRLLIG
jgi:DNA-binding winged helix-turn-helix (wHTH) protein/tetratricopeptide (TPR) repeat protein